MRTTFMQATRLFALGALFLLGGTSLVQAATNEAEDTIVLQADNKVILSQDDMNASRGGESINTTSLSSSQSLDATTSGNAINVGGDLTNGNIALGDNLGGFGSYVMNTGNNSTINSAVSLNIQFVSTP